MRVRPGKLRVLWPLLFSAVIGSLPLSSASAADPSVASVVSTAGAGAPSGAQDSGTPPDASAAPGNSGPGEPGEAGQVVAGPLIWGLMGIRGFAFGQQVAPNGLEFNPLFSLDLDLNIWLWREGRLYGFADTRFWGQKPAPGITNSSQGVFDFSKREFDLNIGAAWNYYGMFEGRAFAYSFNNLNRGSSDARPSGYNDGVGLENRLYIGGSYPDLGLPGFDVSRANFVSLGYYPTKDMVDGAGNTFKPGPFARAYLTLDLVDSGCWYLYLDTQFIGTRTFGAKLIQIDGGTAIRPFGRAPFLEFRLGSEDNYDLQFRETETTLYLAVRVVF